MLDTTSLSFAVAFAGGVLSFVSPCSLAQFPGFVSYISSQNKTAADKSSALYVSSLLFVLGYSSLFVLIGINASLIGRLLWNYLDEVQIIGGAIVLIIGLAMLGLFNFAISSSTCRQGTFNKSYTSMGAFLLGFAFAFGRTPCLGPILSAIITLSVSAEDAFLGVYLLTVYSIGFAIPFLIATVFIQRWKTSFARISVYDQHLQRIAGGLLIAIGFSMISGKMIWISYWITINFPGLAGLG